MLWRDQHHPQPWDGADARPVWRFLPITGRVMHIVTLPGCLRSGSKSSCAAFPKRSSWASMTMGSPSGRAPGKRRLDGRVGGATGKMAWGAGGQTPRRPCIAGDREVLTVGREVYKITCEASYGVLRPKSMTAVGCWLAGLPLAEAQGAPGRSSTDRIWRPSGNVKVAA